MEGENKEFVPVCDDLNIVYPTSGAVALSRQVLLTKMNSVRVD